MLSQLVACVHLSYYLGPSHHCPFNMLLVTVDCWEVLDGNNRIIYAYHCLIFLECMIVVSS